MGEARGSGTRADSGGGNLDKEDSGETKSIVEKGEKGANGAGAHLPVLLRPPPEGFPVPFGHSRLPSRQSSNVPPASITTCSDPTPRCCRNENLRAAINGRAKA